MTKNTVVFFSRVQGQIFVFLTEFEFIFTLSLLIKAWAWFETAVKLPFLNSLVLIDHHTSPVALPSIFDAESGRGSMQHWFPSLDSVDELDSQDPDGQNEPDTFRFEAVLIEAARYNDEVLEQPSALLIDVADWGFGIVEAFH